MGTKLEEMHRADSAFSKAAVGEPLFVLRGQDYFAPYVVESWITYVETRNAGMPTDKTKEARQIVSDMRAWQKDHKVKFPD